MKRWVALFLLLSVFTGMALGQNTKAKKTAPTLNPTDELIQVERDWMDAQRRSDVNKLAQFIADDWVAVGQDGNKFNKQQYLADFKAGANRYESLVAGPMEVWVSGNVAVVQGSDKETSSYRDTDTSGTYFWMDVFQKKAGRWQVVRSQIAKLKQ